jgi:lipopolysaccharide transport system permease protein
VENEILNFSMNQLIIEAGRASKNYWSDLWRYRELFGFLAWRDILVRYKQTTIGAAWAIIRPLLTILIGAGVFGSLAQLPSDGVPYAVMVCAGTLPWYFFASALGESAGSLVGNANLISKVYFPRMILPASAVVVAFVDFAISLIILGGLMLWYGMMPTWRLCALPVFTALAFVSAMGPGLFFTALNVKYRDFRYIIPFIVQFGLYVSPVFYSTSVIQERFGDAGRIIVSVNPIVAVIDGFRWAICGTTEIHWGSFALSSVLSLLLLVLGIKYFRATERNFADVI